MWFFPPKCFIGSGNTWAVFVLLQRNCAAQHAISKANSVHTTHLPLKIIHCWILGSVQKIIKALLKQGLLHCAMIMKTGCKLRYHLHFNCQPSSCVPDEMGGDGSSLVGPCRLRRRRMKHTQLKDLNYSRLFRTAWPAHTALQTIITGLIKW